MAGMWRLLFDEEPDRGLHPFIGLPLIVFLSVAIGYAVTRGAYWIALICALTCVVVLISVIKRVSLQRLVRVEVALWQAKFKPISTKATNRVEGEAAASPPARSHIPSPALTRASASSPASSGDQRSGFAGIGGSRPVSARHCASTSSSGGP